MGISGGLERALGSNNPLLDNLVDQVTQATSNINFEAFEFSPSPQETWNIIERDYSVRQNYLIKFDNDSIDQTSSLLETFRNRGCTSRLLRLSGSHITPLGRPGVPPSLDAIFIRRLAKILTTVAGPECDYDFSPMQRPTSRYILKGGDEHDNY